MQRFHRQRHRWIWIAVFALALGAAVLSVRSRPDYEAPPVTGGE